MTRVLAVTLGALFQVAAVSCLSFCPTMPSESETLRNVVVAGNNVIVGSSSTLYRLTTDLVEIESVYLPGGRRSTNRLLVADRIFGGAVLACGEVRCNLSPINRLSDMVWRGLILEREPGNSNVLAALSLTNNGTLSVTYGTRQSATSSSTITRGSLLDSFRQGPYTYSVYAEQREQNTSVMREFLAVFSNEGYQFFVVRINNETHITRLCLSDNGEEPSPLGTFASYFELELKCLSSEFATAANFVNSTEPFGVETVLVTFQVTNSDMFHICAFNLSEINKQMDRKFEACITASGNAGLRRNMAVPCQDILPNQTEGMQVSTCNIGQMLEVDTPLDVPFSLLSLEQQVPFKSILYTEYQVNGSHFLFLGAENGRLLQVHLVNATYAEVVRDVRIIMNTSCEIAQLVSSDDGEYIYALTTQQLVREPVNPSETISIDVCNTSSSPVESPSATDPMDFDVVTSTVTAVMVAIFATSLVVTTVALIVIIKKHKKANQNLRKTHSFQVEECQQNVTLSTRIHDGSMSLTKCIEKLPPELVIPSNMVQLLRSIGQGEFGIVYKAHLNSWHGQGSTKVVAVKTLKGLFTVNDVHSMTEEILKMKHFDHPNVMTLIGVCVSVGGGPAIVMPFMENGSLLSYLRKDEENITIKGDQDLETIGAVQRLLLNLCLQVAKGMEYLALQNVVHRDLAARNCMIDLSGVIKISDFQLAENMFDSGYFRQVNQGSSINVKLPFKWMPLESLQEGLFSQKSDVWSFGVTCWEVFTAGKIPYAGVDPLTLIQLLEDGRRLVKPSNVACSVEIYSIMQSCWESEPQNRPQFSELVSTISSILESTAGYLELAMSLQGRS